MLSAFDAAIVDETMFRLDGRVAVVTGGASGIGRATAELLARVGATVVLGDIDETTGQEVAARIRGEGGTASFRRTDIGRHEEVDQLVSLAVDTFGRLDVMCNIAGAPAPVLDLVEVGDDELDRELLLTLKAVLRGCKAASAPMSAAGGGSIVNISSTAIDIPAAGYGLYHLGKTAVAAATRILALELGGSGIRVNVIAPGATLTGFSARGFTDTDGGVDQERRREWLAGMASQSPLQMVGSADDQALLVLYLVSDAARFVTGQVVRANGGWSMS